MNAQYYARYYANRTAYARLCGYTGSRPVVVSDGRVVTHRNLDWFEFLLRVRHHKRPRNRNHTPPHYGQS